MNVPPAKPNTQLLRSVWNQSKDFISTKQVGLDEKHLDNVIANIFSNGPFYFYILDFFDMQITYMSPLVKHIHGLAPERATFQDILDQIHPDDADYVSKAEALSWDVLFNHIGIDQYTRYKTSYCFRFRTADGSYQLFNHQAVSLKTDENNKVALALNIHTNISHLTNVNNYTMSVIGMFGEPSFLNIDVLGNQLSQKASDPLFSKREEEVIRLMSEGLTSREIAERLFIAHNTVKNHRKNIFQKAGCKNAGQLITKCITEGLL